MASALLSETEQVRFKIINRLAGYRLIVLPSGCWVREGKNINRYSSVLFDQVRYRLHVLSAVIFHNHKFEDKSRMVCHKCNVEACCNPEHIYSGTAHDNSKDIQFKRNNNIIKGQVMNRTCVINDSPMANLEFP